MEPRPTERDRLRDDIRTTPGAARGEAYEHEAARPMDPDLYMDARGDARDRSIGALLKDLRDELTTLFRQEIALAKTEMSEKASKVGSDVGSIAFGGACLLGGFLISLLGLAALLYWALDAMGMRNMIAGWVAPLIVGVVFALIGWGLVKGGLNSLKRQSPVPEKTVQSLKEDKQWLTNQVK